MAKQEGPRGFEMREQPGDPLAGPLTFASLVLSLSTSALLHLGVAPHPDTDDSRSAGAEGDEAAAPNLPMAKQVIDILEMLVEKTKGNLDADEAKLLEDVLHDLHLRFVEAKRKS